MKQDEPIVGSTLGAPKTPSISASYDGSSVNVSWSAVDRASSYTVYRSGASEKVFSGISDTGLRDDSVQAGASYDGSGVNVSWSAVDRASSYRVYRSGASEKVFSGISDTGLRDDSVQKGASYSYSVVAVDEYGIASDKSSKAEVSIK